MADKKKSKPDDIEAIPLEKCFEELESIVSQLEEQTVSIEESLKLFERGMRLSQRCSRELTAIERKIQLVVESSKGQPVLEPFENDAESE